MVSSQFDFANVVTEMQPSIEDRKFMEGLAVGKLDLVEQYLL